MRYLSYAFLLAALLSALPRARGDELRIRFPGDPSVLDARRDFGAKGDGKTDDTDALQHAIDASCGIGTKHTAALFIPDGVYRVTRTLVVKNALGPWLYGESRDGVVIRLDDGVKERNSVLRTHPQESGKTSADWFMRNLRNFTVDVGNNPATDGIRYYATNSGILKNVRVIGHGKIGVNAGFLDQSGPNLIQDVSIDGFETGILSQWIWGETLSRVNIRNCRETGLVVSANAVGVEDLTVDNTPQAIHIIKPNNWGHWAGVVALVNGKFSRGSTTRPAIDNEGVLYARHVQTDGFKLAIHSWGGDIASADVAEYSSHEIKQLFEAPKGALQLPIRPEPAVEWETDPSKWVCANEFGAQYGDNKDDTAAIQKAIDAAAAEGKTTVYLRGIGGGDPNWYNVDGEIRVHGSVRCIMGLGFGRIIGGKNGRFVVADDATPGAAPIVKFQNIDSFGGKPVTLENASSRRTLVVESCGVHIVGTGQGDIFATDCPGAVELRTPGQKLWARQLNPEGNSDVGLVRNHGADLWALGVKCEGQGIRFTTTAGGRTEVLGAFMYDAGIQKEDDRPMFEVDNASLTIAGLREISFGGPMFRLKVRQKKGDQTRALDNQHEGGWIGWSLFSTGTP